MARGAPAAKRAMAGPSPLTPEDLATFERDGVVILRRAIAATQADHTADEVWNFSGQSADNVRRPASSA